MVVLRECEGKNDDDADDDNNGGKGDDPGSTETSIGISRCPVLILAFIESLLLLISAWKSGS